MVGIPEFIFYSWSVGIPELNTIRSQASLRVLVQREDNKYNTNMHLSYPQKKKKHFWHYCSSERVQTVQAERTKFVGENRTKKKGGGGRFLPFSSCLLRLSRGTKVPSALAITSDFVFAYCILCDNHKYQLNSVDSKKKEFHLQWQF